MGSWRTIRALYVPSAKGIQGLRPTPYPAWSRSQNVIGLSLQKNKKEKIKHGDDLNLENEISDLLNLPVKIKMENPSKGKVIISFSMIDELEGFLQKIKP